MDKQIYLGFAALELRKLLMYETYYDIFQPHFKKKSIQLHYMDTDNFVSNINTNHIIKDLRKCQWFVWFQQTK